MTVALAQRLNVRGATRFEFAIAMAIFAILAGVLLQKVNYYQYQAEQANVRQVVALLRTALVAKEGELYARGKTAETASLAGRNPMELLTPKPANYLGEVNDAQAADVAPGSWYFVRESGTLSYVLSNPELFIGSRAKRLNFKVKFIYKPGVNNPGPGGLFLEQLN
jgi:hypothetical protein